MDLKDWAKKVGVNETVLDKLTKKKYGLRPALKEAIGKRIIKKYQLFDRIFPGNEGWSLVSNKKDRLKGVDYKVFFHGKEIKVDFKSCIGESYEDKQNRRVVPIEIFQNHVLTNTSSKESDYVVYTICDKHGISWVCLPYKWVYDVSLKAARVYVRDHMGQITKELEKETGVEWAISNNGTGTYIKYPFEQQESISYGDLNV